jgi:hypothetical protein
MLIGGVVGFAVGKAIADPQLRRRDDLLQTPATAAERDGWHVNVLQWNVVF